MWGSRAGFWRVALIGWFVAATASLSAQVILDGTLGPGGPLSGPDFQITSDLGRVVGPNLFHSFSRFDLTSGESATFSGPNSIDNVLARVTGGQSSLLDGTVRSTIPGADLYLVNPWGVIFGPNAQLDVSGSVVVSTADYLQLGEGGRFDAAEPARSVFTSARVEAFGFLDNGVGVLEVQASQLEVAPGRRLAMVAGDVNVQGALISAPEGAVQILSVSSAGEYVLPSTDEASPWAPPEGTALGRIGLSENAAIRVETQDRGMVWIRGGQLVMESSSIEIANRGGGEGAALDLAVTGDLHLRDEARIRAETAGIGTGPSLNIRAGAVLAEGYSRIATEATETASGRAGPLALAAERLELVDGARVFSGTYGWAEGGALSVKAETLEFDGWGRKEETGIESTTFGDAGRGRAGDVVVEAQTIRLFDGAHISTSTQGLGDAGNLTLQAGDLLVDSMHRVVPDNPEDRPGTGIFARTSSSGAGGQGGNALVQADNITLRAGEISVSTRGAGSAGSLRVEATQLSIDGQGLPTGLFAQSLSKDQPGRGGDLMVIADRVEVVHDGRIQTSTLGPGKGGSLTVRAGEVLIDGHERSQAWTLVGIHAQSVSQGAGGDAGSILIEADRLTILGGGGISASTAGLGAGGDATIRVNHLRIDGDGELVGISANSNNPGLAGPAGDLTIEAGRVELINGAEISAGTFGSGRGGKLTVVADEIFIDDGPTPRVPFFFGRTGIFANSLSTATGQAGDLRIKAGNLVMVSGASISAGTTSRGDGGTLTITADRIELVGSGKYTWIGANTTRGQGGGDAGDLTIDTGTLTMTGWSQISAATWGQGQAGRLSITANEILLDGQNYGAAIAVTSAGAVNGGSAGDLVIDTQTLRLTGWSVVNASTQGSGAAGNIMIAAEDVLIDGGGRPFDPQRATAIGAANITGASGGITLRVGNELKILGGGMISANTYGPADGGSVTIEANRVCLDGAGVPTGVLASSRYLAPYYPSDAGGNGGQITIVANELILDGGGLISASTERQGRGGSVDVVSRQVSLSGGSSVQSRSTGAGPAGRVHIQAADGIGLTGGSAISSSAQASYGGDIRIESGTVLNLEGSEVTTQAAVDGGNIHLSAPTWIYLLDSRVSAEAGNDGGNVNLFSTLSVWNRSQIIANAIQGDGGDIMVGSPYLLPSVDSTITASSEFGVAGRISFLGPALDLTGGLIPLDPYLAYSPEGLPPTCGVNVGRQVSTFVVTGLDGIPLSPLGWQPGWPDTRLRLGDPELPQPPARRETPMKH